MSDMKYDAIVGSGIEVVKRIPIRPELVPADAQVEIDAKVAAGYAGKSSLLLFSYNRFSSLVTASLLLYSFLSSL